MANFAFSALIHRPGSMGFGELLKINWACFPDLRGPEAASGALREPRTTLVLASET